MRSHINVREAFALYDALRLLVNSRPDFLLESIIMDIKIKMMFHAVQKGKAPNELMHNLIRKFLWLQVDADFAITLR